MKIREIGKTLAFTCASLVLGATLTFAGDMKGTVTQIDDKGMATVKTDDGKEHKVNVLKPFELKGGETIHVDRAAVVYIYGEVTRAGAYPLVPDMTVMQAIAAGGGITTPAPAPSALPSASDSPRGWPR